MALQIGEALWAAGDFAVDAYFSRDIGNSLLRAGGKYIKRKAQKKLIEGIVNSVTGGGQEDATTTGGGEASRRNGRLGGRPPWKHKRGSARTREFDWRRKRQSTNTDMDQSVTSSGGEGDEPSRKKRAVDGDEAGAIGVDECVLGSGGLRMPERHLIHKQLTFRHYLVYSAQAGWHFVNLTTATNKAYYGSDKVWRNADWCYLPYNWFNCYMSARDFQAMNVAYKRWRVVKFGVHCHNIIPFVDDIRSTGGNSNASVEISPLTHFEAFTDVHGELPMMEVNGKDLPNNEMTTPFTDRSHSTLKVINLVYNGYEGSDREHFISMEQSPSFQLVDAAAGFSYSHEVHPVDQQWRHAMFPMNQSYLYYKDNYTQNDQFLAPILGRNNNQSSWIMTENSNSNKKLLPGVPGDNLLYESWQFKAPHHPPPKILLRVPEVMKATGAGVPYAFVMHVTYKMTLEAEPNFVCMKPIIFSGPSSGKLFTGERESFQCSGGDCHGMMRVGNKKGGYANIDVSTADIN
jgi:hypothetical protein